MKIKVFHMDWQKAREVAADSPTGLPPGEVLRELRCDSDIGPQENEQLADCVEELERAGCWRQVAEVDTPGIEAAYVATNSIDMPWKAGERSTSVGDLLVIQDGPFAGRHHLVADAGFVWVWALDDRRAG